MAWKKILLGLVASICVLSWIGVGIGFFTGMGKETALVLVTIAAVATEGLFWAVALVLGVGIYESRQRIKGWIAGRLGIGGGTR